MDTEAAASEAADITARQAAEAEAAANAASKQAAEEASAAAATEKATQEAADAEAVAKSQEAAAIADAENIRQEALKAKEVTASAKAEANNRATLAAIATTGKGKQAKAPPKDKAEGGNTGGAQPAEQ